MDTPNNSEKNLIALIRKAQANDEIAFSELFALYLPLIDNLCASFEKDLPLEQELRSESILSFWNAVRTYNPEQENVTFGLYARICMKNRLTSILRKKKIHTVSLDDDEAATFHADEESNPAFYVAEREQYDELRRFVGSVLSESERQIWFRYVAGHTAADIAKELGKEKKSVENAIFRARKKLRTAIPPRN